MNINLRTSETRFQPFTEYFCIQAKVITHEHTRPILYNEGVLEIEFWLIEPKNSNAFNS